MLDDEEHTSSHLLPQSGTKRPALQANLNKYLARPVSLSKAKQLDKQLIKMIVKEYHPFSLVEDPEFREFVNILNPGYTIPSRKTASSSLLPKFYNEALETVKEQVSKAKTV